MMDVLCTIHNGIILVLIAADLAIANTLTHLHFRLGKLFALAHNGHERSVHSLIAELVLKAGKVLLQFPQTPLTERELSQALSNVLPLALIPAVMSCDCHVTMDVPTRHTVFMNTEKFVYWNHCSLLSA